MLLKCFIKTLPISVSIQSDSKGHFSALRGVHVYAHYTHTNARNKCKKSQTEDGMCSIIIEVKVQMCSTSFFLPHTGRLTIVNLENRDMGSPMMKVLVCSVLNPQYRSAWLEALAQFIFSVCVHMCMCVCVSVCGRQIYVPSSISDETRFDQ